MPILKSKNILIKMLSGNLRKNKDAMDYLSAGFERFLLGPHSHTNIQEDNDGDSMISITTMETVDNQPGTGRFIDTYIFQPIGRRIERLAMRYTIASLHPARIAQYIEADDISLNHTYMHTITMHEAVTLLCSYSSNGSTIVAGIKGLVKQTQSNSIERSAYALAALIRVALSEFRREVCINVSRTEPIFHLEALAGSLFPAHPDKKWFFLLVRLARETLLPASLFSACRNIFDPVLGKVVRQVWPSPKAALNLRQRLIQALNTYRLYGLDSLDDTLGEACAICSVAVSVWIRNWAQGDAYMHMLETVYFTAIFILRSIHELADFARITANRHIYMVMRTIAYWMDAIVHHCLFSSAVHHGRFDMDLLKENIAFRSLYLANNSTRHMLLPESYNYAHHLPALDKAALPRRNREATKWYEEAPLILSLIEAAKQRTRRLLTSFNELEREVWGGTSQTHIHTSQSKTDADLHWIFLNDFGDVWWTHWKSKLRRARGVQVPENHLTEEHREARRIGLERISSSDLHDYFPYDQRNWAYYQLHRGSRHKWGQYLRSNMDWNWNLGLCMKRLFKIEKQNRVVGPSPGATIPPNSSFDMKVEIQRGETWNFEAQHELPKEVRIEYKTDSGETQYMSFIPASSVPGRPHTSERCSTGSSAKEVSSPTTVQQDSGHDKGSSGREQEIQDPETGALDTSQKIHVKIMYSKKLATTI